MAVQDMERTSKVEHSQKITIGNKTAVSVGLVIVCITALVSYASAFTRVQAQVEQNTRDINSINDKLGTLGDKLDSTNEKLDQTNQNLVKVNTLLERE